MSWTGWRPSMLKREAWRDGEDHSLLGVSDPSICPHAGWYNGDGGDHGWMEAVVKVRKKRPSTNAEFLMGLRWEAPKEVTSIGDERHVNGWTYHQSNRWTVWAWARHPVDLPELVHSWKMQWLSHQPESSLVLAVSRILISRLTLITRWIR